MTKEQSKLIYRILELHSSYVRGSHIVNEYGEEISYTSQHALDNICEVLNAKTTS